MGEIRSIPDDKFRVPKTLSIKITSKESKYNIFSQSLMEHL